MRLWTIHPRYLDTKGLLAAWREALLAQKVLQNKTKGYRSHPQLLRFKKCKDPEASIANYLRGIYAEAVQRGYNFDANKIAGPKFSGRIRCTRGQLLHEWSHLKLKLSTRDEKRHSELASVLEPEPHPLFRIVDGDVEAWERLL
ncbi:MAG TPA: pyrimidine dimer DNA glycosylase/endonuclease V [Pyrinomonadaceae bacterium]